MGKLIPNLVPEARTLSHSIFGSDPVAHSRDTDTNVENADDVPDKTRGPEDQQEGRLTVPVETADLLSPAVEGGDKSPLVFDATRHRSPTYSFSAASIEREALVLLDTIQGQFYEPRQYPTGWIWVRWNCDKTSMHPPTNELAGHKISGTPIVFLVLCFFLFFAHLIILLRNKFSLPLLLLTLLSTIAPVFNIFSDDHFLQNPCRSTACFVTREAR